VCARGHDASANLPNYKPLKLKTMKITEAWDGRQYVIDACKQAGACEDEFKCLIEATTQTEFEAVLLRNFSWCVKNGVLEEWLPESLPDCEELDCYGCTSLKALPELPECERLHCYGCTSLQALPELPKCERLYCHGCTSLKALPELPECKRLDCDGCTSLSALPELPECKRLDCDGCTSLSALPELPKCKWLYCDDRLRKNR
jgi:hypothetical protein